MLQIDNIEKSYGPQTLFDGASIKINPKERIGLVGRNGHGKTTLMRILAGEEHPDDGQVVYPKNYRLGYVRQHLAFTKETVIEEVAAGLPEDQSDEIWKVERILAGLGFSVPHFKQSPNSFSGGFQVRLNLAKVLASDPDMLLLDEPTNYLDITSIRWMERFLASWQRELILITHDRGFMDRVVTHVVGIHRKRIRKIPGNTEKFYTQIAQEEEVYEKTRLNDEKRRKEIEQFVRRFRAKARLAGMVQSRIKSLEKMDKKDKLEDLRDLEFSFRYLPYRGKYVLHAQNLTFGYDAAAPLIRDLSFTIGAGERVCIIGRNGQGKTTLLKLLSGLISPQQGDAMFNPGVEAGVYEQTNISSLNPDRTVEEEVQAAHPDCDRQTARNICGGMMFEGDAALKPIRVLSGGEKSRVMLGRLLATPANLLFLDEPTNHLDMNSCDALLEAIDAFAGTVVMVTHNEMFLHALADRLVVFRDDGIMVFDGGYQDFLDQVGWEEDHTERGGDAPSRLQAEGEPPPEGPKLSKKELRKARSEIVTRRSRALRPLEQDISRIEAAIEEEEDKILSLTDEMQQASMSGAAQRIGALSQEIGKRQARVDDLYESLEIQTETFETQKSRFDDEIAALEGLES